MNRVKTIIHRAVLAVGSLPSVASTALAAKDISISTFTDSGSDFWAGVEPIKGTIIKLIGIVVVIYGVSLITGTLGGGIKTNLANIVNNIQMRSEGYKGIVSVVIGLVIVSVVLAMCFSIWNDMFSGKAV